MIVIIVTESWLDSCPDIPRSVQSPGFLCGHICVNLEEERIWKEDSVLVLVGATTVLDTVS